MKKLLAIMVLGLLLSSVAMANQVELKGFKLGLTKKEFKKINEPTLYKKLNKRSQEFLKLFEENQRNKLFYIIYESKKWPKFVRFRCLF